MIGRVFEAGRSFSEASHYVSQDLERAVLLAMDGVRGRDYKLMAKDFELQHRLRPEVEKPVFHAVLSFATGENPGDDHLVKLAKEWMEEIGIRNTQAAIVRHIDTTHVHAHVLANRISNNGEIIGEGLVMQRGIRAARMLTQKYGLPVEEKKNMELINRKALNEVDAKRYRLYEAIRDELPFCRQLEDLEARLARRDIAVRYKLDPVSGARLGISFRIENHAFKGSQVDPDFSLRGLAQRLAQLSVPDQEQKPAIEKRPEVAQKPRRRQRLRM